MVLRAPTPVPGVLRGRLVPPVPPTPGAPRRALVERIRSGLSHRLTALVAAAGYGKSAALSMALAAMSAPFLWLSCDRALADDPALLVAHLAFGLSVHLPGGVRIPTAATPEEQVAELGDALLRSGPRDLVVVLDGAETLRSGAAAAVPTLLARQLPADVHLAIASRSGSSPLPGQPYAGPATELGEQDLAMDADEALVLMRAGALPVNEEQARLLAAETEGWVAGMLLAGRSAVTGRAPGLSWDAVSGYLEQEVVGRLPSGEREFMRLTSVLERVTPELAAEVTGRRDAGRVLRDLHADHMFVFADHGDRPVYRYHRLLRRLLLADLHDGDPGSIREIHGRAARGWRAAGAPLRAVPHHLAAGEPAAAARAVAETAENELTGPRAPELADALAMLPDALVRQDAVLALARAAVSVGRAPDAEAVAGLRSVFDRLLEAGRRDLAATAAFWLLRALVLADTELSRGLALAAAAIGRLGEAPAVPAARVAFGALLARAGRWGEADAELDAAARTADGPSGLAGAYAVAVRAVAIDHPQGRSEGALEMLESAIIRLDRYEQEDPLGLLPEVRAHRATVLSHLGEHEEALAEAGRMLAVARRRGLGPALAPTAAQVRMDALAALGRWAELAEELGRVTDAGGASPRAATVARVHLARARLAVQRGDRALGAGCVRAAAEGIHHDGAPFDRALLLADVALAAVDAGDDGLASRLAAQAYDAAVAAGAPWARARAAMLRAASESGGGAGRAHMAEALELTARWSLDTLWTRGGSGLPARLLQWAVAEGIGPDGVAPRLARASAGGVPLGRAAVTGDAFGEPSWRSPLGLRPAAAAGSRIPALPGPRGVPRSAAAAEPVVLQTLGRFAVWRGDGTPVPVDFRRRKARILLGGLLAADGPISRGALVRALWPKLDPAHASAALHSTVHTLRHALEPGLDRGARTSRVVLAGDAYALVLREEDEWDAARFLRLAARALAMEGERAVDLLKEADAAHAGPFLPEWNHDEWVTRRREQIGRTHLAVLEALGGRLLRARRVHEAIDALRRLVALEPDHEAAHRALTTAYLHAGERGLALRQYDECIQRLRMLGVRPTPETQALHDSLVTGAPGDDGWIT